MASINIQECCTVQTVHFHPGMIHLSNGDFFALPLRHRKASNLKILTTFPNFDIPINKFFFKIPINKFFFKMPINKFFFKIPINVGSMVEWLKRRAYDQHGLGWKPTRAILLCFWERHFTTFSLAWWSWQAVLNLNHISIKLQANSNILASPEAGRSNCLPYVLAPPSVSCESGG